MSEITIWDMCPYCDSDVELHSFGLQPCPVCGLHFEPSEEAIEASLEEQL